MTARYSLFAVLFVGIVLFAQAMKEPQSREWNDVDHSKYIKFSHKFHVKEQEVACEDCHQSAKSSTKSSDDILANHESCTTCHEDQISANCTFCHLSADDIVAIPNPDRELMFSHQLHADSLQTACLTCHAGVDTVTYATTENLPPMKTCMDCHSSRGAPANCEVCHTDFAGLVPSDHLAGDFRKDHKIKTRLGEQDISCATCHAASFCQDCHTGIELQGFGSGKDLMADPSSRGSTRDSPKQLRLQQAHSLNYRFTHGIDARSKNLDCSSCHERQSFCVNCHEAGDITRQKIKPESHSVAGFTTIGKGSGGGRHAELARQDIEACAACHDVQGRDPVCMTCHTDGGSVR